MGWRWPTEESKERWGKVQLDHMAYSKGLQSISLQDKAGDQTIPSSLAAW